MQSINDHPNAATDDVVADDSHVIQWTQMGALEGEQNILPQGLSLSLGSQMPSAIPIPSYDQFQCPNPCLSSFFSTTQKNLIPDKDEGSYLQKELTNAQCMTFGLSGGGHGTMKMGALCNLHSSANLGEVPSCLALDGLSGFSNTLLNSKYLNAAQQLLDEMVSVRKAMKKHRLEKNRNFHDFGLDGSKDPDERSRQVSSDLSVSTTKTSPEPSPAERQALLSKKTQLLSMLDEVDKRYRQYSHQMQVLVSSFDAVAGCGAAQPYTALAFQTISRHFRCLRDAISGQIQVTQRSLGEQEGIPRLRFVDQQLRQQKALQQLGVMRQAWRPQRGLPENSVSILRAWMFEHFLHPYPKDSEKIMLARQTGLTRSQVANWFINARVRLWKPMVEEMYKEEFGDSEMNCSFSSETAAKAPTDDNKVCGDRGGEVQDNVMSTTTSSPHFKQLPNSESNYTCTIEMDDPAINGRVQSSSHDDSGFYSSHVAFNQDGDGGLVSSVAATYDISELGNSALGQNQVSLALELRNFELSSFPVSGGTHRRGNGSSDSPADHTDLLDYHLVNPGKQQQRTGNPHMLHEFVV